MKDFSAARIHNDGIISTGSGNITAGGNMAMGRNTRADSTGRPDSTAGQDSWDIGIITALSVEMREVGAMLRRVGVVEKRQGPGGQRFHESAVTIGADQLRIVGTQTLNPGQRSAAVAFQHLRELYSPDWIVLIGIAGGVHPGIEIGDVVIAQEVIYYDMRKETKHLVRRRGQGHPVPAATMHAVNDFFAGHDSPLRMGGDGTDAGDFRVVAGPIGSGEAVVADRNADILAWVRSFNDKTLAVETEAGGVAQAFFEGVSNENLANGWLVIRGISDKADAKKDDAFHAIAARHAARVFEEILPYLVATDG